MRRKVIAGNFKMNKTPSEVVQYVKELKSLVSDTDNQVIICVPYVDLADALRETNGTNICVGAQNVNQAETGAYTGEISPLMLNELGIEYVIIGHSERRQYYNETDESVNAKLKSCFEHNLKPILCVGETLEQRQAGEVEKILSMQVVEDLKDISAENIANLIIAYEPIWAIGTGVTASKEDANDAIKLIRNQVENIYGKDIADELIIQYGGSVKSSNAKDLFEMSDIDGGLVGGASLIPEEFAKIVNYNK